jgi:hypothetical protein
MWWSHLVNLFWSSVRVFVSSIGTNLLGFLLILGDSVASIGISVFRILRKEGISAMREHWKRTAWVAIQTAFAVTLVIYGPVAIYSVVKTVYDDHQGLVNRLNELNEYAKNKADYDRRLRWAEGEVRHWQDAYQRAAKGETKPDRIMNHEEEGALYDDLIHVAQDPRNKDYIKIELTSVAERESRQLTYQLWQVFHKAHWDVPIDPKFSSEDLAALNGSAYEGVTIFTDDPANRGRFLQFTLRDANIDSQVYPLPAPTSKGTIIMVGVK